MAIHKLTNNFTAGELTPLLKARPDLEQYDRGCEEFQNFRPLPYGGARYRPGTVFIAKAKFPSRKCRLVPFQYSTRTRFMLEFGHEYIRFYSNNARVEVASVPVEVVTPYQEADLFEVQHRQINDVVYFVHPDYPPYKLSRLSDTSWTMVAVAFDYPPLREENTTDGHWLHVNNTTGTGITLESAIAWFDPSHVGAYFELRHLREADGLELSLAAASGTYTTGTMKVRGDWSVVTTERWYGTLYVERSTDGGSTWEIIRLFKSAADRNVSASGTQDDEALLRMRYVASGDPYGTGVWVGSAPTSYVKATAKLESEEAYAAGLVKVVQYIDSTHCYVDIINEVASTDNTEIWSEGAWSNFRGWPRSIGLYEQRVYYGGNAEKPNRFWGSVTGDFENFEFGDEDDKAIAYDIAATEQNFIQWLIGQQKVFIGTEGGEYMCASGNTEEPVTPTNIAVRGQDNAGSVFLPALQLSSSVIFVHRQARRIMDLAYSLEADSYGAQDITLMAEHITAGGVVQLGFCRQPDPLLLAVRADGVLLVCTYDKGQNVKAWGRWVTDGSFESVASVYGTPSDEIWTVAARVVGGATVRCVERVSVEVETKAGCHLDSAVLGTATSNTITGLSSLEGSTVQVVMGGSNCGSFVVSGGQVVLPDEEVDTLGDYVVGRPYVGRIKSMPLEVSMANGSSKGRRRRITKLSINFKDALGGRFGADDAHLDPIEMRDTSDHFDSAAGLWSGPMNVTWNGGNVEEAAIILVQDQPFPMTILNVVADYDVFGE